MGDGRRGKTTAAKRRGDGRGSAAEDDTEIGKGALLRTAPAAICYLPSPRRTHTALPGSAEQDLPLILARGAGGLESAQRDVALEVLTGEPDLG